MFVFALLISYLGGEEALNTASLIISRLKNKTILLAFRRRLLPLFMHVDGELKIWCRRASGERIGLRWRQQGQFCQQVEKGTLFISIFSRVIDLKYCLRFGNSECNYSFGFSQLCAIRLLWCLLGSLIWLTGNISRFSKRFRSIIYWRHVKFGGVLYLVYSCLSGLSVIISMCCLYISLKPNFLQLRETVNIVFMKTPPGQIPFHS